MSQRLLYLLALLSISGCSSLETDCLSLAPTGTWSKAALPNSDIVNKFAKPEPNAAVRWFKNREGQYGVCYSVSPVFLYLLAFMALVVLEELIGVTIIGEGYARILPLVFVFGVGVVILCTLVFSIALLAIKGIKVNAT